MQEVRSRKGTGFEITNRACSAQVWIRNKCILWISILATLTAPRLMAVVDAHSPANTNAPPDGAPWDHVGTVNGASGIYVGNGWVVGARRVGWNNFLLNGQVCVPQPATGSASFFRLHLTGDHRPNENPKFETCKCSEPGRSAWF